ncbi:MAG: hypothetical protein QM640_07935 [Niabella sp.]
MKKTIVAAISIAAFVIACSPKASKSALAGSADAGGAIIASAKCTKCHGDETGHVARHTFADQEKLFINMAGKAKLTWAETQDLMAYVTAHAQK